MERCSPGVRVAIHEGREEEQCFAAGRLHRNVQQLKVCGSPLQVNNGTSCEEHSLAFVCRCKIPQKQEEELHLLHTVEVKQQCCSSLESVLRHHMQRECILHIQIKSISSCQKALWQGLWRVQDYLVTLAPIRPGGTEVYRGSFCTPRSGIIVGPIGIQQQFSPREP